MRKQKMQARQSRTVTLIHTGALLQKAGLFEAFSIQPGDNLQVPEMRVKAERLLGFLVTCFQEKKDAFNEAHFHEWQQKGRDLLRLKTSM